MTEEVGQAAPGREVVAVGAVATAPFRPHTVVECDQRGDEIAAGRAEPVRVAPTRPATTRVRDLGDKPSAGMEKLRGLCHLAVHECFCQRRLSGARQGGADHRVPGI